MTENASAISETSLCLMLIHSDAQRNSVQGYAAFRAFSHISTLSCNGACQAYLLRSDAATALQQVCRHVDSDVGRLHSSIYCHGGVYLKGNAAMIVMQVPDGT